MTTHPAPVVGQQDTAGPRLLQLLAAVDRAMLPRRIELHASSGGAPEGLRCFRGQLVLPEHTGSSRSRAGAIASEAARLVRALGSADPPHVQTRPWPYQSLVSLDEGGLASPVELVIAAGQAIGIPATDTPVARAYDELREMAEEVWLFGWRTDGPPWPRGSNVARTSTLERARQLGHLAATAVRVLSSMNADAVALIALGQVWWILGDGEQLAMARAPAASFGRLTTCWPANGAADA